MKMKSKVSTGVILILLGTVMILSQFNIFNEYCILPIITAGLFAMYFISGGRKRYRNIGFLIPACILPVIQLVDYFDEKSLFINLEGTIFFSLMAAAFLLVYFIHSFWYKQIRFGKRNWPIITSIVLFIFSILTFSIEYMQWKLAEVILNNIWPAVLIIAGVILIIKNFKSSRNPK